MSDIELRIPARAEYLSLVRAVVAAAASLDPRLADSRIDDLRLVVSEATTNAIEAHATDIDVRMSQNERPVLLFSNNGAPIPADVAREIFIPFFTTKSSGTGIGLSLSRQMLMMQNIELGLADTSISGYHVTFYLEKQKD